MIAINGAGIAGLTLANFLQQQGIDYFIIEKAPALTSVGAGIVIQKNGLEILAALGLEKSLKGNNLCQMSLGNINKLKHIDYLAELPIKAVHRSELQQLLLSRIPRGKIYLGRTIKGLRQDDRCLKLMLSEQETKSCDFLIEAGGVHAELHGKAKLTGSGQHCWRKIITCADDFNQGAEYWFGKHRLGVIPIGGKQLYVFHVHDGDLTEKERLNWLEKMLIEQTKHPLLNNLDISGQWIKHELSQREVHWGQGRVLAIGDAAHALTPNFGQGAVLAMEDAYCLASLIGENLCPEQLRQSFVKQRHRRVCKVQKQSWQAGKMAHFTNQWQVFVRDFILKIMPHRLILKMQQDFINQFVNNMKAHNKGI
jgi:2-polyprenyl-6-methoxyphenol hydroxylase-like FAD-dependent oxidoreductase